MLCKENLRIVCVEINLEHSWRKDRTTYLSNYFFCSRSGVFWRVFCLGLVLLLFCFVFSNKHHLAITVLGN